MSVNFISASMVISGISNSGGIVALTTSSNFSMKGQLVLASLSFLRPRNVHRNPANVPCMHEWLHID